MQLSQTRKRIYAFFLGSLLLDDIDNYRFLTNGKLVIPNVDDAAELSGTLDAMKGMDFAESDIDGKWYYFWNLLGFSIIPYAFKISVRDNYSIIQPVSDLFNKGYYNLSII